MGRPVESGGPLLTVIVPTRNEAGNIEPLLDRLTQALHDVDYQVLFVDDSTDATPEVIAGCAANDDSPVTLIHRSPAQRNGLSGAVVEGLAAAKGEWVGVMDADLQHPPEAIRQLLHQAERTGADLVVASRRADFIGPVGLSRARAMTSQTLTILARLLFPRVLKNVSDPLTGFFLVRRSALDLTTLQPDGFKILLEILVRHPELHVSEIYFDFAPRHEGQSKADLNEGMRFFRHLTRLRWSVNQHLARFLMVILLAVGLHLLLLALLVGRQGWSLAAGGALAGGVTVLCLLVGEAWVFSDRAPGYTRRRLLVTLLLSTLYLFLLYLPMLLLMARAGVPYMLAALFALTVAGFIYYLFSEYWIWTRGLMMRPRSQTYYNVHDILTIASQVPLPELAHFMVKNQLHEVDLQVRVDRHGTPSRPAGAIAYDEHLGRFGFGLTVLPGDYTEIVVSPLLESSPSFLYTNVVEPVMHWMLVARDHAFPRVAALAMAGPTMQQNRALLLSGAPDMAYGLSRLAADGEMAFMGDDRAILSPDGRVWAFPKPVTVNREMLEQASAATRAVAPLFLQRLVYSRRIRQLGIWLGERRLPTATLNTTLQRLMPQPKYDMRELAPRIQTADAASAGRLIFLDQPETSLAVPAEVRISQLVTNGWAAASFQPLAYLATQLATWDGQDWIERERAIVHQALRGAEVVMYRGTKEKWWEQVSNPREVMSASVPGTASLPAHQN